MRILWQDDSVAVVWKPPGVRSSGGWETAENAARLAVEPSALPDALEERSPPAGAKKRTEAERNWCAMILDQVATYYR